MAKTERVYVRMTEADRDLIEALAENLRLDLSSTVLFLVADKCRALGITVQPPPAKKKRRASGS